MASKHTVPANTTTTKTQAVSSSSASSSQTENRKRLATTASKDDEDNDDQQPKQEPKQDTKRFCNPALMTSTITITFGDRAENHVRMEMIGTLADSGFTINDLKHAQTQFEEKGYKCEFVALPCSEIDDVEEAAVLVIRNGINCLLDSVGKTADDLFIEQNALKPDKKAFMYGRVVDKHARHNLCFDDQGHNADYEKGVGTVVSYSSVPLTSIVRDRLPEFIGAKATKLAGEGDGERRRVVAFRLGASIPLHYQWFLQSEPVGDRIILNINHGDVYIMSDKAVGFDWKKKTIATLRHAAGAEEFTTIGPKKKKPAKKAEKKTKK